MAFNTATNLDINTLDHKGNLQNLKARDKILVLEVFWFLFVKALWIDQIWILPYCIFFPKTPADRYLLISSKPPKAVHWQAVSKQSLGLVTLA